MKELDVARVCRTNELIGEWLLNYLHLRVYIKFLLLISHALDIRKSLMGTFNGFLGFFEGVCLRYSHLLPDELERSSQLLGLLQTCLIFFIKQHEKRDDFLGLQNSNFVLIILFFIFGILLRLFWLKLELYFMSGLLLLRL